VFSRQSHCLTRNTAFIGNPFGQCLMPLAILLSSVLCLLRFFWPVSYASCDSFGQCLMPLAILLASVLCLLRFFWPLSYASCDSFGQCLMPLAILLSSSASSTLICSCMLYVVNMCVYCGRVPYRMSWCLPEAVLLLCVCTLVAKKMCPSHRTTKFGCTPVRGFLSHRGCWASVVIDELIFPSEVHLKFI
jgi:hypothetical protein